MAAWADRIKAWFGGGDAGVPGAVAERARGVAQGSPDAIRVVAPDAGPVVAPFWTHGGGMDQLTDRLRLGSTLLEKYVDYELMDDSDLLSAALDVIADDCTIRDLEEERCVWATGADDVARGVVDELLEKRLTVEDDAWSTIRTMGKYGQSAAEIVAGKGGVVGLNYLPIATMRKVLDHRGQVQGYVQSVTGSFEAVTATAFPKMLADRGKIQGPNRDGIVAFHPWEIVWWQMPSKQVRAPYGVSALDPVRWAWKRLNMLEDAAIVFRLVNGAAHYVLRAEVGTMAPKERATYLQQVKSSWKKRKVTDSSTGQLDFRAAPLASDEVIVVPVMEGKESVGIDVLNGPDYNIIDDLTYFQNKLVSGLGIPRTHLGLEQEATRASLSSLDVQFARSEMRRQRQYMAGLRQIMRLHLALLDIDPDTLDVGLDMTVPSSILEMAQVEAANSRAALAAATADFYDRKTILVDVLGKSEAEAEQILRARREDAVAQGQLDAAVQGQMLGAMQPEGGLAPEGEAAGAAAEQVAQETEAMRRRLDALSEQLDGMGVTARRTEERMRRLPVELRRIMGGRR